GVLAVRAIVSVLLEGSFEASCLVELVRADAAAQWGPEVLRVREGRLISRAVPGFWLAVEWLFQEPLPPASACLQRILSEKAL
ncbi:MAG: hypothetical protein RMK32_09770, partial [Anaerolineae bacterium]|nr:hypothetical protein [Anaerolineae bacterium]